MIQDILNTAINSINAYYDTRAKLQNNKKFSENLIKLSAQTEILKKALVLDSFMENQSLIQTTLFSIEDRDNLLGMLDECGEKVVGHDLDAATISLLERDIKKIVDNQKNGWIMASKAYADNVVDSLNSMASLLDNPAAAHALKKTIEALQTRWPITEQDIIYFKKKVAEGQSLLDTLPIDDPEILEFIKKLSKREATLNDLTDKALLWVRRNDLESRIKLLFAT